jgi:hypothetical protein
MTNIMKRINIRVDSRLKHELEAEAREKGVSLSEIVRRVLEEQRGQRCHEPLASQSGFSAASDALGTERRLPDNGCVVPS